MERIAVNVSDSEHKEIKKWAGCEGCSMSGYFIRLHRDYVFNAKKEGRRTPEENGGES